MPRHGEIVIIKRNGTDGTRFPLTATSCLFGRKPDCDIRIQVPQVSKEHCKVEVRDNGQVFVANMSSVNPSQLNGNTITEPIRLKHGDIITIIDRSFRFEKLPANQGTRRSTGLDSETFKVFASNQSSDTNETVRIDTLVSNKTQRKSEGSIAKSSHSRRSLQISSSSRPHLSPFGELYEMLKSQVGAQKENGKTPVKDKSSSPKIAAPKRSLQIEDGAKSPIASKRNSRRSQSTHSPATRPMEIVVEPRSASTGRVREASKSLSRSPKASTKESSQGKAAQELEQTTRKSSSKRDSQSVPLEQVVPTINGNVEKPSPRRSAASAEQSKVVQVQSTPRRRSDPSIPEQPVLKIEDKSPGRRRANINKTPKATPAKPMTEGKKSEAEPRKSPKKRRSDELSLPDPPPKRKRVSFGGHLSPELFDKRLPPNSPLKKGATPARRSLSLNSPRIVVRKSFGPRQSMIKEIFEQSESSSISATTPTRSSKSSPAKSSAAVTGSKNLKASPAKQSAPVKTPTKSPSPARRSVSEKSLTMSRTSSAFTPVKNSPARSPVKTPSTASPKMTPVKKSPSTSSPGKSPSRSPKKTPVKSPKGLSLKLVDATPVKSPTKRSPLGKTPTLTKRSPVAKTPTPAKRSPVAKTPSPAKRSPVVKTPTPVKRSPVAKASTPAKRSPVAKTPTSSKRSPVAKTPTPPKRSPVAKTPTPAKRSPVAKTPTPAKRSPVAKTPTPAKRSPAAKTPTPAKRSPAAKTPTPAKRSPAAKTPTPAKRSPAAKTPAPAKRSPAAKTPAPAKRSLVVKTPGTPYVKGRFSVSRIDTPPQEKVPIELPVLQTPKTSRKSLSIKKTPRRSRKLEAFELIRSKRRSGATEANLLVSRTWADVVKIGIAKSQKKTDKPVKKVEVTKRKLKHKTPMKKAKNVMSTGHADSPATILVGRAHTRTVNLTGYVPKVVRNQAVKLDSAHNESFTGVAELFSTPESNKQRRSNRLENSNTDSPSSVVVEMSVMQTPEESGEMVVSPLNSPNTTRRKQYNRDAVSRLLQSPASSELSKNPKSAPKLVEGTSKSKKDARKSVGLSGVKRIMTTPKQKAAPITDSIALKKLLKTPKETESPQAYTRRSANLEVLGIDRLLKTPKQKAEPLEDFAGVRRIMRTPKDKAQPVEDMIGIKRIMRTPKEKSQPVEDMVGIKRLMRTPKERGQPIEDFALNHLLNTPVESVQSTETTRPIEEIFGIRNLIKTPPKSKEVASTDLGSHSATSPGNTSANRGRGRPPKRLSLLGDTTSGTDVIETTQSQIVEESVTKSTQEVVKSTPKRGRPPKNRDISSPEVPKEQAASAGEVVSPRRAGRPSSTSKALKESISTSAEVTSPTQYGKHKPMAEQPKETDGKLAHRGKTSITAEAPKEPEVTSPKRRGRPSSTSKSPKESLASSDVEVASPRRRGRPSSTAKASQDSSVVTSPNQRGRPKAATEEPKETVPVVDGPVSEVTSPRRRGRPSSTSEATKKSPAKSETPLPVSQEESISVVVSNSNEVVSPRRRGRPSSAAKATEELLSAAVAKVASPTPKGRLSATAEMPKESAVSEVTSPTRTGRPSSSTEVPEKSLPVSEVTSPSRRGRPKKSAAPVPEESVITVTNKVTSPERKEQPSTAPEVSKESVPVAEGKTTSQKGRGRQKVKADLPQEPPAPEVQVAETTEVANTVAKKLPAAQTRRGKPAMKASASIPEVDASSPTRGSKSQGISEVPKSPVPVINDVPVSEKRRGRPKATDVSKESVSIVIEAIAPTRGSRSKKMADASVESGPTVEEATSQKYRGRHRKAEASQSVEEVASSTEEANPKSTEGGVSDVTSPTRKERSRNIEVPKETVPVTEVTSPKRGRKPVATEELNSAQKPPEETIAKPAKSTKKTARQNVKSSKQNANEQQVPEPEESIVPAAENKTQLPPARGRRKAAQTEPSSSEGEPSSSLVDEQPEKLTAQTSPVSRRGGRRKNAEVLSSVELDVVKPKTPKLATRGRGQSKSKDVQEDADSTTPVEPAKSPEPKSPKRSVKQRKDLEPEPSAESQAKSSRSRPSKKKESSSEANTDTAASETEVSQKAVPARGRSRSARDISNTDEQTKGANAKQQKSSRRNLSSHTDSSLEEQPKPVALEDAEPPTRATRGKKTKTSDSDEPQAVSEVKGRKNARGKTVQNVEEQTSSKSKAKSVQWHPLLATEAQSTTEVSAPESNEVSTRGGRSKGKAVPDTSEIPVPAKRSRRGNNQADSAETPAPAKDVSTVSDVAEVPPRKKGKKANVEDKDAKSTVESNSTEVHTSPQRGRRGAKVVDSENNEVRNVEPSASRRQRGATASKIPSENESTQSPVKAKSPKGGAGKEKTESPKSTRGVKRKLPIAKAKSDPHEEPKTASQPNESVLIETENIPASRGRKNQKTAKTQKVEVPERSTVTSESPAKRRKTDAAPTAAQKRSSRQKTSKPENEKPSASTRTSTRSKK